MLFFVLKEHHAPGQTAKPPTRFLRYSEDVDMVIEAVPESLGAGVVFVLFVCSFSFS